MLQNQQVHLDSIPTIADIQFSPLAHNAKAETILSSIVFLLPFTMVLSLVLYFVVKLPMTYFFIAVCAIIILDLIILWWSAKAISKTGVALRERDFVLKRGLFWRKTTLVPFNRIQHIEIHRSPFERKFHLATLKLYTAGGSGADLSVGGLDKENAEQLKQFMLTQISSERNNDQ